MTAIPLFSTFITSEEILDWRNVGETIQDALLDEAYSRWFTLDRESAEFYEDCWQGFVHVKPSGGYNVWIEAEPEHVPGHEVSIPVSVVQHCRNLMAELGRIGRKIDSLGVAGIPMLVSLDERCAEIWEELADELIGLLTSNNLASLGKETNDG